MHEAAVWLRDVNSQMNGALDVDWRYFSLEQVNSKEGEDWHVWDQPEEATRSLAAFKGAEAARRQGAAAFERFHHALLEARHKRDQPLTRETVEDAASDSGLDIERFRQAMAAADILASLARDHQEAVGRHVFGTPTIFFAEGTGAYLKMKPASSGPEALRVYETFRQLVAVDLNIGEIKRPRG